MGIELEYTVGMEKEMHKHFNHKIVENLDGIWTTALNRNKERKASSPSILFLNGSETEIEDFYSDFKLSMHEFTIDELKKYEGDNLKSIFKRKVEPTEIFKPPSQEE